MGEPRGIPCHKLPFPIYSCPWCGSGIKVTRAVFKVFKPRLEYVSDGTEPDEKLDRMRKAGAKIVEVPADDPDHH